MILDEIIKISDEWNLIKMFNRKRRMLLVVFTLSIFLLGTNSSLGTKSETVGTVVDEYELGFSTYFGGDGSDFGWKMVIDDYGNVYVTGRTNSLTFPTKNAWNSTPSTTGNSEVYVAKFDSNGHLLFSTYLGGSQNDDAYGGIAVDKNQNIFVIGETYSQDFPIKNAYQNHRSGSSDCFLTKFDKNGEMVFSTFLGGSSSDYSGAIAVDSNGEVYVSGYTNSIDFPMKNAWNSTYGGNSDFDTFIAKYSSDGELLFSSYYGGSSSDTPSDIDVDNNGNSYIVGSTVSINLPTTNNAYQSTYSGGYDGYLAKFNATGSLIYSTFVGGNNSDSILGLNIKDDSLFISGWTNSLDFATTTDAYNTSFSGGKDAFIMEFVNNSLIYCSYFGGSNNDLAYGIQVDSDKSTYIVGSTYSSDLPTLTSTNTTHSANLDCFVTKFNSNHDLEFSTFYGGSKIDQCYSIGVDMNHNIYIAGYTSSTDLEMINSYYPTNSTQDDIIIAKFSNIHAQPLTTSSFTETTSISISISTTTLTSNQSIQTNELLSNPVIQGIAGVSVVSVLVNAILIIKRK